MENPLQEHPILSLVEGSGPSPRPMVDQLVKVFPLRRRRLLPLSAAFPGSPFMLLLFPSSSLLASPAYVIPPEIAVDELLGKNFREFCLNGWGPC